MAVRQRFPVESLCSMFTFSHKTLSIITKHSEPDEGIEGRRRGGPLGLSDFLNHQLIKALVTGTIGHTKTMDIAFTTRTHYIKAVFRPICRSTILHPNWIKIQLRPPKRERARERVRERVPSEKENKRERDRFVQLAFCSLKWTQDGSYRCRSGWMNPIDRKMNQENPSCVQQRPLPAKGRHGTASWDGIFVLVWGDERDGHKISRTWLWSDEAMINILLVSKPGCIEFKGVTLGLWLWICLSKNARLLINTFCAS